MCARVIPQLQSVRVNSGSRLSHAEIVMIVTRLVANTFSFPRKVSLRAARVAVIAEAIVFALLDVPQIYPQSASAMAASVTSFEVASIKPNHSGSPFRSIMSSPGRFTATGTSTKSLIEFGYDIRDNQLLGGPSWIDSEKYDIEGKEDDSFVKEFEKLPSEQQQEKLRSLVRSLLAERFKLQVGHETKELPVYALVVAKNGPKLQESKPGETYSKGPKGPDGRAAGPHTIFITRGKITGQGVPTTDLARLLTDQLGRTVLDKSGLGGSYDFSLEWQPETETPIKGAGEAVQGLDNMPSPDSLGSSIFTAIQEQLGLKLESQKGSVEVLVVQHVERPSEN